MQESKEYEAGYKKGQRDTKKKAVDLIKNKLTLTITDGSRNSDVLIDELATLIFEIERI